VSEAALKQAILLNGTAVERNARAFDLGRIMAHAPEALIDTTPEAPPTLDQIVARRVEFLTDYQDAAYAERYRARIERLRAALPAGAEGLVRDAAISLFRLMAIKDEYEVARLHTETGFLDRLHEEFEGDFKVSYHMAPPALPTGTDARGRPQKIRLGAWLTPVMRRMAALRGRRGTGLDPFARSHDRRLDRELLAWFGGALDLVERRHAPETADLCGQILAAPQDIRGYGPVRETAARAVRTRVDPLLRALDAADTAEAQS
jgi:indolepyruvate ferredoxin oxidoreductase